MPNFSNEFRSVGYLSFHKIRSWRILATIFHYKFFDYTEKNYWDTFPLTKFGRPQNSLVQSIGDWQIYADLSEKPRTWWVVFITVFWWSSRYFVRNVKKCDSPCSSWDKTSLFRDTERRFGLVLVSHSCVSGEPRSASYPCRIRNGNMRSDRARNRGLEVVHLCALSLQRIQSQSDLKL